MFKLLDNIVNLFTSCFKKNKDKEYIQLDETIELEYPLIRNNPGYISDSDQKIPLYESVIDDEISKYKHDMKKNLFSEVNIKNKTTIEHNNSIVFMTYNISTNSSIYDWHDRLGNITKIINDVDADIYTFFECNTIKETDLIDFMKTQLSNYFSFQFVGGDDCYIVMSVNKDKYEINYHGMKWLTDTPDTKSNIKDTNEMKIIAYLYVTNIETKKKFWIFSSQLCKNEENKPNCCLLISDIVKNIVSSIDIKSPIILSIDQNYCGNDNMHSIEKIIAKNINSIKPCSSKIYAYLNKQKNRINGNIIGYKTSDIFQFENNKIYGNNNTIMGKKIKKYECYTLLLNNCTVNQPSCYLPIILYITKNFK